MAATVQHDVDHYEVLRLPSGEEGEALSVDQIEKAYRVQALLRHPDKRRHDPAATADFQALRRSYNILRDESLRREFDARLRARRVAAAAATATGVKRRKAVSDLEERERAFAVRGGSSAVDPAELASREDKLRSADLKRELDEFFDARRNFIAASTTAHGDNKAGTPDNGTKTDKGKVLKVSWKGGADYYNAAKLVEIFSQLGEVQDVVIMTSKSNRKGSSIVVMASKEAALCSEPVLVDILTANRTEEPFCLQRLPSPINGCPRCQHWQLQHLNRGQATLMELDSAIWKHRCSKNFKRPRKGSNVDNNWCFRGRCASNLRMTLVVTRHNS